MSRIRNWGFVQAHGLQIDLLESIADIDNSLINSISFCLYLNGF